MEKLLKDLAVLLPDIRFEPGQAFHWSPRQSLVTYERPEVEEVHHSWSLLHEASHALLGHQRYQSDLELLLLEATAWQRAKELASQLGTSIDEEHIQDCLDTYRDWLHQRSTCPRCQTVSLETAPRQYQCHNCSASWQVSASRMCRPYRKTAPG